MASIQLSTGKKNLMLPGNPRYQPKSLTDTFGYDNLYRGIARVEIANLQTLAEFNVIPPEEIALLTPWLQEQLLDIRTTDVDIIERTVTNHDIRAWVKIAQDLTPSRLARWMHVPLTSYDPLETARAYQFIHAYHTAVKPRLHQIVLDMAYFTGQYANTLQSGRTHGQIALPITVGFWMATVLSRLVGCWQELDHRKDGLVGKISGAVGAYNAQYGLGIASSTQFEAALLDKMGLKPAPISTQILPPEPMARFLNECILMSGVIGQLGRDCRHLMRSEIAEIFEYFGPNQTGSSTMAHKRNPITFENMEGMFLRSKSEYGKVLDTLISEHQRDLVGSSLLRDFPIIMVNLVHQLDSLTKVVDKERGTNFLQSLRVDVEQAGRNFKPHRHLVLAEPLYIAMQMAGYEGDAHHLVNHKLVSKAKANGSSLLAELQVIAGSNQEVRDAVERIPGEVLSLLEHPESYVGLAPQKAYEVAERAKEVALRLVA